MYLASFWGRVLSCRSNMTRDMIKNMKIWFFTKCQICTFLNFFFLPNSSVLQSYLRSYLTYRSMLNLKSMLKTFYLNLILSVFWLTSIIYEVGSKEVASFFWPKLHKHKNCKIWHFLKNQIFRFFIISLVTFDLQESTIPQIKIKDISFWLYFLPFLATVNIS